MLKKLLSRFQWLPTQPQESKAEPKADDPRDAHWDMQGAPVFDPREMAQMPDVILTSLIEGFDAGAETFIAEELSQPGAYETLVLGFLGTLEMANELASRKETQA